MRRFEMSFSDGSNCHDASVDMSCDMGSADADALASRIAPLLAELWGVEVKRIQATRLVVEVSREVVSFTSVPLPG